MTGTVEVWNLDHAAAGAILGLGAVVVCHRAKRWTPTACGGAAALGLVLLDLADPLVVAATALALAAPWCPLRIRTALRILAVALVAGALRHDATAIWATVAVVGLAATVGLVLVPAAVGSRTAGLALVAVGATCWLCVPDTEAILVVTAAATLPGVWLAWRPPPQTSAGPSAVPDWFPVLLLLLWATAAGFRGRPAGIPAAWVAFVGAGLWLTAEAAAARQGDRATTSWSSGVAPALALAVTLVTAVVGARTFGLADTVVTARVPPWGMMVLLGGTWTMCWPRAGNG